MIALYFAIVVLGLVVAFMVGLQIWAWLWLRRHPGPLWVATLYDNDTPDEPLEGDFP